MIIVIIQHVADIVAVGEFLEIGVFDDLILIVDRGFFLFQFKVVVNERFLRIDGFSLNAVIGAVRGEAAGFDRITPVHIDVGLDLGEDVGILNGEEQFHAVIEVAGHPVGGAEEELLLGTLRAEEIDAAVFEETSHDGAHFDILAQARHIGSQTADATHKEPHVHACRCRLEQFPHDIRVGKGVHLGKNRGRLTGARLFLLGADEIGKSDAQSVRCHNELLHDRRFEVAGDGIEENGCVLTELTVGGEQGIVGVHTRRHIVVIAGAEVEIALDAVGFAADNESDFGVGFQTRHAVDDVGAHLGEVFAEFNVVFLIEARLDFHQCRDLLAVVGCTFQRGDDGAVVGDAVKGLFDGEYIGVVGGFIEQAHHRVEAVEGVVHQNILAGNHIKDTLVGLQFAADLGGEGTVFEMFKAGQRIELLHEEGQIDGTVDFVNIALFDFELFLKEAEHFGVGALGDFQPDDRAALAFLEGIFNLAEQVNGFFLVKGEVAVAGDTVGHAVQHGIAGEEFGDIHFDDLLDGDEEIAEFGRQLDEALEIVRHLHGGKDRLFAAAVKQHADIEALVEDEGEGVAPIHRQRGQHGIDGIVKKALAEAHLIVPQRLAVENQNAVGTQLGDNGVVIDGVFLFAEGMGALADGDELLLGGHARRVNGIVACAELVADGSHAHHKKFVEIGGDDG